MPHIFCPLRDFSRSPDIVSALRYLLFFAEHAVPLINNKYYRHAVSSINILQYSYQIFFIPIIHFRIFRDQISDDKLLYHRTNPAARSMLTFVACLSGSYGYNQNCQICLMAHRCTLIYADVPSVQKTKQNIG